MAREGLFVAAQDDMINGDYAFLAFELDQVYVEKKQWLKFLWFETDNSMRNR